MILEGFEEERKSFQNMMMVIDRMPGSGGEDDPGVMRDIEFIFPILD